MFKKLFLGLTVTALAIVIGLTTTIVYANGTVFNTTISNGGDAGTVGQADTAGDAVVTWIGGLVASTSCVAVTVSVASGCAVASLSPDTTSQNLAPGSTAYYYYSVCNAGNNTDTFSLSVTTTASNYPNGYPVKLYRDDEPHDSFGGEPEITATSALSADTTFYLIVAVTIPSNAVNGSSTTVRLTVKDRNGAGTEDNWPVAGNDTVTNDTFTKYSVAMLALSKSSSTVAGAPYSGAPLPGGYVEYTLVVTNTGVEPATNVVLKDRIPANTTFRTDAYASGRGIQLDTVNKTNAADADEADYTSSVITVNLGTVTSGQTKTVKFQIQIQ